MSNDRQKLIRQFALAIVQGLHANPNDGKINWVRVWEEATAMVDAELPQPEPEPEPEHTREDWAEVQGDVKRLTKDVERLSGTVEALKARIRCAARLVRETSHELACGYAVSEDTVERAVQILEEGSDD
jgi:hypothetical protein